MPDSVNERASTQGHVWMQVAEASAAPAKPAASPDVRNDPRPGLDKYPKRVLDKIASRLPASQSLSAVEVKKQWQVLEQAAKEALAAGNARDEMSRALGLAYNTQTTPAYKEVLEVAYRQATINDLKADSKLASAILKSPFNADEIRKHFPKGVGEGAEIGNMIELLMVKGAG
jgi:hypothetical protein